jgi:DNA-binding Lrp family transcriptional regulator
MTLPTLRAEREKLILKLLQGGAQLTRMDICNELNHEISENGVHSIMKDLEKRGLVRIEKRRISKRFSRFAYFYFEAPAA